MWGNSFAPERLINLILITDPTYFPIQGCTVHLQFCLASVHSQHATNSSYAMHFVIKIPEDRQT